MTASDDWTWEFRPPAARAFERLDPAIQQRIVSKLDEIVTDEWREPPAYVEPLSGVPHGKIRIGDFRLGAAADRENETLLIYDIEHRSGAYRPGDD
ncbi:type II toxin-antitoxin system RelE family toxin [Halorubrum cibi]|uniref:mRNA-degrading endonuclease RelE, toxin component of the RelBE toxin-antitoxin system n=1 Tax=Halorubrum cibi TaxID=413815 RepID=A0A521ENG0_9EURY|nr:type II toxin-antitoxin system RelE/ParE family toxin [Halorubrum cibi]SMO84991.1 mRNA-degrading endonuclease RelE, toxin component of the RelBE toxin-antitoxin system [Halorubrum cibi]